MKCPTCSFLVPEHAERCPQCGRVFGEVNRCPSCHAIAAVVPASSGYKCAACGKPRELKPGTTILGGSRATSSPHRGAFRALGGLLLVFAILGASASTALLGINALGIGTAALVALAFSALAFRFLGRGQSVDAEHAAHRLAGRRASAQKLLQQGALTKEDLAAKLSIGVEEADAVLSALAADEASGVRADVDESAGVLRFSTLPAVRIADPDAPSDDEVAAAAELESKEQERKREA